MQESGWHFEGSEYRVAWDASRGTGSLAWGERIQIPVFFPLFSAAPLPGQGPEPVEGLPPGLPSRACTRMRRWNRPGILRRPALLAPSYFRSENGGALCVSSRQGDLSTAISLKLECGPDRITFSAELENRTGRDLRLHALIPLAGSIRFGAENGSCSGWRFFKMASNTTVPSGSVALDGSERGLGIRFLPTRIIPGPVKRMFLLPDEEVSVRRGSFSSQWFTLLVHPGSGATMLVGFTGVERHFSTLRLDVRSSCFQAAAQAEGYRVAPGERFASHPLVVLFGKSPGECIDRYLNELAGTGRPRLHSVTLWGSWYTGFYDRFGWEDLTGNMEAAARAPQKIDYFQLDDGYQRAVGDWKDTLPRLPEGLEGFARRVRQAGMKPGVWVAPFAVGRNARVYGDHPEWLVRGPSGRPVLAGFMAGRFRLRPYYGLDLTRPEVLDWLHDLFHTLSGWGFELFKLDFLAAGTIPGVRHNASVTAARAYHDALCVIRRAVGDGILLGALAPQLCGLGIMDVQRVSTDSSFGGNAWKSRLQRWLGDAISPCVHNNLRNNFTRVFFGDRLWVNDCDAVLSGGGLSPEERDTHQTVNLLLGGVFQVGFDLRKAGYPWESIARLRSYRPWFRHVPDLFETDFPQEAMIGAVDSLGANVLLYLLVNATERTVIKVLRDPIPFLADWKPAWDRARNLRDGTPFFSRPGETATLPPRGSLILEVPLTGRCP